MRRSSTLEVSELVVPLAWLIGLGAALGAGRPLEPRVLIDSVRRVVLRAGRRRVAARSVGRVGGLPFVIRGHRYVPLLASWVVGLDVGVGQVGGGGEQARQL